MNAEQRPDTRDPEGQGAPRVLRAIVVTGSTVIGEGLRSILGEARVEVVGQAQAVAEAIRLAGALGPDLVIVEAQVLTEVEAAALGALREAGPQAALIVLSVLGGPVWIAPAIAAGASAYLCRNIDRESLVLAIEAALQRQMLLDRAAFDELSRALEARPEGSYRELVPAMTAREWEVLELMARGQSYREIAVGLSLARATVRSHACRIVKKLQVADRAGATQWAAQHGMGQDPRGAGALAGWPGGQPG